MADEQCNDIAPQTRVGRAAPGRRARVVRAARKVAGPVVVAMVLGLAVLAWVGAPAAYQPYTPPPGAPALSPEVAATDRAASTQAIVTTRASVLAALAGLGALVTIGINYRNSRTQLRNAEIAAQTLATTQETFRVTERGHQTGRYTAAIEQLGNAESIAIRLGGIYALEQLARDSGRSGDQATVVEVLSAFIRLTTSRTTTAAAPGPVGAATPLRHTARRTEGGPAPDVAAALTVLGRLPHLEGVARANLAGADLAGARLFRADLGVADLGGANLTDTDLGEANLAGAYLGGANLAGAVLQRAILIGTNLSRAELSGANLRETSLTGAYLGEANLIGARLDGANLSDVNLDSADLTGARLDGAILTRAYLGYAVAAELFVEQWETVRVRPDGTPSDSS